MFAKTQFANLCESLLNSENISSDETKFISSIVYSENFSYKDYLATIASRFKNIGAIGSQNSAEAAYVLLEAYSHNTFTISQFEMLVDSCALPVAYALIQNKDLPIEFFYSFERFERLDEDAFVYNKDFIAKAFRENFYYFRRQKSLKIINSIKDKLSKENIDTSSLTDEMMLKIYGIERFAIEH